MKENRSTLMAKLTTTVSIPSIPSGNMHKLEGYDSNEEWDTLMLEVYRSGWRVGLWALELEQGKQPQE